MPFALASVRERNRPRRRWSVSDMGLAAPIGISNPDFSSVVAQLDMAGTDGSTSFVDSTGLRTWTASGDAQIDTSLGYNAALFDAAGDFVATPYVKADLDWWDGDFNLEGWIHASSFANWSYNDGNVNPSMVGCADPASGTNYWSFGPNASGNLMFYYYNGGAQRQFGDAVPTGADAHIAVFHRASDHHILTAVNGDVTDHGAVIGTPQSSATSPVKFVLGMINNRSIDGYVIALRATRALHYDLAGFTPDAYPFPSS